MFNSTFVELTGVEPVSKQETNTLSTCLSVYWFSCDGRQSATYQRLNPLNFHCGNEAAPQLFPSHERLLIANRGTGFAGNVLSGTLCRIKLIYYDSIKLQERKYFRHFLFCDPDLRDISRGSTCLQYPFTLLSKPNSPFNLYYFAAKINIIFK